MAEEVHLSHALVDAAALLWGMPLSMGFVLRSGTAYIVSGLDEQSHSALTDEIRKEKISDSRTAKIQLLLHWVRHTVMYFFNT